MKKEMKHFRNIHRIGEASYPFVVGKILLLPAATVAAAIIVVVVCVRVFFVFVVVVVIVCLSFWRYAASLHPSAGQSKYVSRTVSLFFMDTSLFVLRTDLINI